MSTRGGLPHLNGSAPRYLSCLPQCTPGIPTCGRHQGFGIALVQFGKTRYRARIPSCHPSWFLRLGPSLSRLTGAPPAMRPCTWHPPFLCTPYRTWEESYRAIYETDSRRQWSKTRQKPSGLRLRESLCQTMAVELAGGLCGH